MEGLVERLNYVSCNLPRYHLNGRVKKKKAMFDFAVARNWTKLKHNEQMKEWRLRNIEKFRIQKQIKLPPKKKQIHQSRRSLSMKNKQISIKLPKIKSTESLD